jgi:hypothetical protein
MADLAAKARRAARFAENLPDPYHNERLGSLKSLILDRNSN